MPQHRAALSALLRPRLKPPGFNDSAFLRQLDAALTAAGVPRDTEAATGASAPGTTPTAAPTAPTLVIPRALSDPPLFFRALRDTRLFPEIIQSQVDGINFKLTAFGRAGWPISFAAYGFATSYWETGRTMQPCREKGSGDGPDADPWDDYLERYDTGPLAARLGNTPEADGDGVAMAGKGDVQLTGAANYRRATVELRKLGIIGPDVDLVKTPELVLRPDISAVIMVLGMEQGWFTGRKLSHTLPGDRPATLPEFVASRPIINGRDKDDEIGAIAVDWQAALKAEAGDELLGLLDARGARKAAARASTPGERRREFDVLRMIAAGLITILLAIIVGLFATSRPGFKLLNWAENVLISIATATALKLGDCLAALVTLATGRQIEQLGHRLADSVPSGEQPATGKPHDPIHQVEEPAR